MKTNFTFFVTGLLVVSFLGGCGQGGPGGGGDRKIVAKVGPVKITTGDLGKELEQAPAEYKNYLSTLEGKKQFLDILLKEKILLNAAERSGVSKRPDIQKSLKDFKERLIAQEKEYRKGIILREYLRELQDGELTVSDAEVEQYYQDNSAEFKNPIAVSASHILASSETDAALALKRIQDGESFSKVAEALSSDPSASQGGLIGQQIRRGDLSDLPEFEKELFKLKSGAISGIVKTKIGYHIIKNNKTTPLPSQSLEDATLQIRRILEKDKFNQWVEKQKKQQKLWIDETVLASVTLPKPQASEAPVVENQ